MTFDKKKAMGLCQRNWAQIEKQTKGSFLFLSPFLS